MLYMQNPLLDAVIIPIDWSTVEPQRGHFSLDALKQEVNEWHAANKHVVLELNPYGQEPGKWTPNWLYEQSDVQQVGPFAGGGAAAGKQIRIPAVWKDGFATMYFAPVIKQLAKAFDGDSTVWYVQLGLGHIGCVTAQPSAAGAGAMVQAGWTPEKWETYCQSTAAIYKQYFKRTPLLFVCETILIRNRQEHNFQRQANEIFGTLTQQGIAGIYLGLGYKNDETTKGIYQGVASSMPAAACGACRLGFGRDWPLWVPEYRRTLRPTVGCDEAFFQRTLDSMFMSPIAGKELPTTIIYCNPPEILASNPSNTSQQQVEQDCYYRPAVYQILNKARERLLSNDKNIFGQQ